MGLSAISLFSGAGGLDLAAKWAGIRTVAYCEWDRYAQAVLVSRMRDGGLDEAPLWDDVSTFDGKPWAGKVDIVFGGFPCQDVSSCPRATGEPGAGIEGERSGLWKEFARIIREVGPRFVVVENVPGLLIGGGLGVVLGDLADLGFNARWQVLSARAVGAPHLRERVFIVADSGCFGLERSLAPYSNGKAIRENGKGSLWWPSVKGNLLDWVKAVLTGPGYGGLGEPPFLRTVDGVAFAVDQIKCCGNGVVPQQALPFFQEILEASGR